MSPTATVRFDLNLRQRANALRRFLSRAYDPSSPSYGRFLSPAQIGARFGIAAGRERAVRRWIRTAGLQVEATYPQRTSILVRGSAAPVPAPLRGTPGRLRGHHATVCHPAVRPPPNPSRLPD